MSLEIPIAISLPSIVLFLLVVAAGVAAFFYFQRQSSGSNAVVAVWQNAADELGINVRTDESKLGPTARGVVNSHEVAIAPNQQVQGFVFTQYGVAFDAPEAPGFRLTARSVNPDAPVVGTGNPKFDAFVAVETEDTERLAAFLVPARRAAILRLLAFWPTAEVLNTEAYIRSEGIEQNADHIVDSICHLVAAAETFERPTEGASFIDSAAGSVSVGTHEANGEGSLLVDVRLDEATVLADLFNSDLDHEQMLARFEEEYKGRGVGWSGEVMRIGSYDAKGRVQVVLLIGSADGQHPESGRVFATTAVPADPYLAEGKVLNFEGTLAVLDTEQRLFSLYAPE